MVLSTLFLLVILGYLVLYVGGRKYLETFQTNDDDQQRFDPNGVPKNNLNRTVFPPE